MNGKANVFFLRSFYTSLVILWKKVEFDTVKSWKKVESDAVKSWKKVEMVYRKIGESICV